MEYEHLAENQPMDGNPSMRGPSESATHIARADCPHLSGPEWVALQRLATVIGEAAVATMLRTLSPTEQHGVALGFIVKVHGDAAAATTTTASSGTTPRVQALKLHVSNCVGKEGEPLLRWLVEIDTAIAARRIFDDPSKVAFAMSCLGGRARSWAYGRRLTDATCFGTYAEFKKELRQAFEPPKNELRSRAEFLELQQGKHDVHAYAQRARYLVSNIVTNPMDEATKVVTFMKGLRDGPIKTYLFREYSSTLEAAITLAMQEEFSLRRAKLHVNVPRMARLVIRTGGPEPLNLSNATAAGHQQRNNSSVRCFRCGYTGHFARECIAAVHKAGGRERELSSCAGRLGCVEQLCSTAKFTEAELRGCRHTSKCVGSAVGNGCHREGREAGRTSRTNTGCLWRFLSS
ncbi:hypothetical protein PI124_g2904 [Phytophthora idaei]|nr:hypothetical protein PI125_g18367 [Phytophthora idaei]KAG3124596.1 hypothetical protein PI126_g23175 [Phytophthora idaei]KAG3252468.1 hypothetical protein PI124_g2904 [Phytophthora idaei]